MGLTDIQERILEAKRSQSLHLQSRPLEELREEALKARESALSHRLRDTISRPDSLNIIADIKRASPWEDVIQTEIEPARRAIAYSGSGATAISVWTEENYFQGSLDDLREVRAAVSLPVLRRDFIIESSQIYESAIAGADALLLIAAILDEERFRLFRRIAEEDLGLDALVEVQNADKMLWTYAMGATLIVVNNRNLSTLEVSLDTSVEVARAAPNDVLLVSENGLRAKKQLLGLRKLGYKGFIMGGGADMQPPWG
ncbi:MAG: indole-3-glycerol-phosphate synthase [Chloracidobacterium sp.]|nr:indole-3-glycerol-phosphate synthase [Chloracidobacterium sp.]